MKQNTIKSVKPFFSAMIICSVIFSIFGVALIKIPESEPVAKEQYSGIPYSSDYITLYLKTSELPVCFLVKLNPKLNCSYVTAFPSLSVKNSSIYLNSKKTKAEYSDFFGCSIDYILPIDNEALSKIIDMSGGIVTSTPFGLPSPSGNGKLIAANESLHIYGAALTSILSYEKQPDKEHLNYYGELIAISIKQFLTEFTEDKYFSLKEYSIINISFADYYNNKDAVEASVQNVSSSFIDGVWMNDYYYIYNYTNE